MLVRFAALLPLLSCFSLLASPALRAEEAAAAAATSFTKEQLEQLVAPVALYPDSLVSQIMMAATYPLEVVEAARWVKSKSSLTGEALEAALKEQDWDPSVKALCGFPDVVARMNDNLDWTRDLGDAFLGQKAETLDAVQRMRGLAYEEGNLKTSKEQVVTQQPDKIIIIEPADPEVIYVPTYSSTVVYGSAWYYPHWYYPALYVAPRPGYGLLAFSAGVWWGRNVWGGCNWGWGHGDVNINVNHYNNFNNSTNINAQRTNIQNTSGNKGSWNHNPEHRSGVNYRDSATAGQYGAAKGQTRVTQDQARGYPSQGTGRTAGASQGIARPSTGATGSAAARPSTGATGSAAARPSTGAATANRATTQRPSTSSGSSAWSGSGSSSMDRSASSRGASSRGTTSYGGASRGGGGGGGGGRR